MRDERNDENNDDDEDFMNEVVEKISVGVCAMSKKVKSKPMGEILNRLQNYDHFEIKIFEEDLILNTDVTEWPKCDCLISFYSKGFPLKKVQEYKNLHNPFLINDLEKQWDIMDRIKVYQTLKDAGIEQPRYAVKYEGDDSKIIEQEDQIELNDGFIIAKPFVEKPINAGKYLSIFNDFQKLFFFKYPSYLQMTTIFIFIFRAAPVEVVNDYSEKLVFEVACIHKSVKLEGMVLIFMKNSCQQMVPM